MKRIVIAPDSFKGTLSAPLAAEAIAAGWHSVRPNDEVVLLPMADGGEGTLDALCAAIPEARQVPIVVRGPADESIESWWLWIPSTRTPEGRISPCTAVVELASTSGIQLLDTLHPFDAHTIGFGQAIAAAIDAGADRILLAIGSSASTDGGAGLLSALGASILTEHGEAVRPGNRGLSKASRIDISALRAVPPDGATILSDVTNPLLGPDGAAFVFGPQKGADSLGTLQLERNLTAWSHLVRRDLSERADAGATGGGAAGGCGFGLLAWGATLASGAEVVANAIGLPVAITGASLVITGEGRYDGQSAAGKVPAHVLQLAKDAGVATALIAGSIDGDTAEFDGSVSLSTLAGGPARPMANPAAWLRQAGAVLAQDSLRRLR